MDNREKTCIFVVINQRFNGNQSPSGITEKRLRYNQDKRLQFNQGGSLPPRKWIKHEVPAGHDTYSRQSRLSAFVGRFRRIVLLAQMTEEHVFEPFVVYPSDKIGAIIIAEMPFLAHYPGLQFMRIRPGKQHVEIVVRFDYDMGTLPGKAVSLRRNPAQVGKQQDFFPIEIHKVSDSFSRIMAYRNGHERKTLVAGTGHALAGSQESIVDLLHTAVEHERTAQCRSRIYRLSIMAREFSQMPYVVVMVMRNQDNVNIIGSNARGTQRVFHPPQTHSRINHDGTLLIEDDITVAAASA